MIIEILDGQPFARHFMSPSDVVVQRVDEGCIVQYIVHKNRWGPTGVRMTQEQFEAFIIDHAE